MSSKIKEKFTFSAKILKNLTKLIKRFTKRIMIKNQNGFFKDWKLLVEKIILLYFAQTSELF